MQKPTIELLQRYLPNPILTAEHWPYRVNSVFNPAATRLEDGTTLLLCRVEDRRGHSHFCVARSADGRVNWQIDPKPTLTAEPDLHPEELWGIEDPRVTYLSELKQYAITYTAYSPSGPAVALAMTTDFKKFERCGVVMPPQDKDAALFPRRIKGRWAMIHRPVSGADAHMWISYSDDLRLWTDRKQIMGARVGGWWDANRIGLSVPPIETKAGWLVIYHGVRRHAAGLTYRVGLALFDLDAPDRLLCRGDEWIMAPHAPYEKSGDVDNVVFPCGYTLDEDGDTLNLYYGAADTTIGLATGSVREMLTWLEGQKGL
jgi:predicted GH43/DUF377 family glycosyl hydrolase